MTKIDIAEQKKTHDFLLQQMKDLLEDQRHLNEIYTVLGSIIKTDKLSRFGCKVRVIQLLHEAHNAREGEISAKELLNGG